MKFSVGQTVKVSLPGCPLDGEIHEITAVQPKELMKYVIQKDSAYYSFFKRELTEATRVFAVYHQAFPHYECEPSLESLWSTFAMASEEVKRIREKCYKYDGCFIKEIVINVADRGSFA